MGIDVLPSRLLQGLGGAAGIQALANVQNSRGRATSSADGIHAEIVNYSIGERTSLTGTTVGLRATIDVGCTFTGGSSINHKYLMP